MRPVLNATMMFEPGVHLGPYEIDAVLGSGGMGEVYRASDPRLGRDVAIKILPSAFSTDPDRLRRFEQEARAAAALNHPNILAVYDIGTHEGLPYVVSELLDGETLRDQLNAGPLPVRKAIDYAIQIAHGLEAAHAKGIVHRDLKPENLLITGNGRVKIVDFGLAKLVETALPANLTTAVTQTSMTMPGLVLGTVGYMSPEQIRGHAADYRSDLFAFGAILYEMLSGVRAFRGETAADTMTAILKDSPPTQAMSGQHSLPALQRIIDRCLEKNPAARFQSAGDLAFALEGLSSNSGTVPVVAAHRPEMTREWLAWGLAGLLGLAAAGLLALVLVRSTPPESPSYRTSILAPERSTFSATTPAGSLVLSPDGRRLAFTAAGPDRTPLLWVRSLDGMSAQPLVGTEGAFFPFWSPDSRSLGFFTEGKIKKIDVAGGTPITLSDLRASTLGAGGTWNRDGVILFADALAGIYRISAMGGTPTVVTVTDERRGETGHLSPFFLPDGRHFLYFASGSTGAGGDASGVYVGSIDAGERVLVLQGGSNAKYAQGQLLFLQGRVLMAQSFDVERLRLTGDAVPVADQVAIGGPSGRTGAFSVSETGVLAFQTTSTEALSKLEWYDRTGKLVAAVGDQADYGDVELSPEKEHAMVSLLDQSKGTRDIWLVDLARGIRTRLTSDAADEQTAIWSPDSTRVLFNSRRKGTLDLYTRVQGGSAADEPVLDDPFNKTPMSWSPDGTVALYASARPTVRNTDLMILPLAAEGKPVPFLDSSFSESLGRFSPNGRWVVYVSNETGRDEVYVTHYPGPRGKWQISTGGGSYPRWLGDGRHVVYLAPDSTLMEASLNVQYDELEVGSVLSLFMTHPRSGRGYPFDISADGQRVLVNTLVEVAAPPPITLVVNWTAGLRKPQ